MFKLTPLYLVEFSTLATWSVPFSVLLVWIFMCVCIRWYIATKVHFYVLLLMKIKAGSYVITLGSGIGIVFVLLGRRILYIWKTRGFPARHEPRSQYFIHRARKRKRATPIRSLSKQHTLSPNEYLLLNRQPNKENKIPDLDLSKSSGVEGQTQPDRWSRRNLLPVKCSSGWERAGRQSSLQRGLLQSPGNRWGHG